MNKKIFSFFLIALLMSTFSLWLYGKEYTIVTGSKNGTYYAFGKEISNLAKKSKLKMRVEESYGSTANVMILGMNQADMAICQYDVLNTVVKNPRTASLMDGLSLVMPLYNEEVHILVRKGAGIHSIADLKGKSVGLGQVNSGSSYTAYYLLKTAGLSVKEIYPNYSSPKEALPFFFRMNSMLCSTLLVLPSAF